MRHHLLICAFCLICLSGCFEPYPTPEDFCVFRFSNEEYQDKVIVDMLNDSIGVLLLHHVSENTEQSNIPMLSRSNGNNHISNISLNEVYPLHDSCYYFRPCQGIGYGAHPVVLNMRWSEFDTQCLLEYNVDGNIVKTEKTRSIKVLSENPFEEIRTISGSLLEKHNRQIIHDYETLEIAINEYLDKKRYSVVSAYYGSLGDEVTYQMKIKYGDVIFISIAH